MRRYLAVVSFRYMFYLSVLHIVNSNLKKKTKKNIEIVCASTEDSDQAKQALSGQYENYMVMDN